MENIPHPSEKYEASIKLDHVFSQVDVLNIKNGWNYPTSLEDGLPVDRSGDRITPIYKPWPHGHLEGEQHNTSLCFRSKTTQTNWFDPPSTPPSEIIRPATSGEGTLGRGVGWLTIIKPRVRKKIEDNTDDNNLFVNLSLSHVGRCGVEYPPGKTLDFFSTGGIPMVQWHFCHLRTKMSLIDDRWYPP